MLINHWCLWFYHWVIDVIEGDSWHTELCFTSIMVNAGNKTLCFSRFVVYCSSAVSSASRFLCLFLVVFSLANTRYPVCCWCWGVSQLESEVAMSLSSSSSSIACFLWVKIRSAECCRVFSTIDSNSLRRGMRRPRMTQAVHGRDGSTLMELSASVWIGMWETGLIGSCSRGSLIDAYSYQSPWTHFSRSVMRTHLDSPSTMFWRSYNDDDDATILTLKCTNSSLISLHFRDSLLIRYDPFDVKFKFCLNKFIKKERVKTQISFYNRSSLNHL